MQKDIGRLYICATPIGNLEDITLRVLRILDEVELIAAEDTRRTRKLLNHYEIHKPLISYHEHNEISRTLELIDKLKSGVDIALVSDAGTPGISDPGQEIIRQAIEAEIPVIPIPGPTAVVAALTAAGFPTDAFAFWGFGPRNRRRKRLFIKDISKWPHTAVLYEAPHRLLDTLQVIYDIMPKRPLAVCRELTKIHEEIIRGLPGEIIDHFTADAPRGECVLVLAPFTPGLSLTEQDIAQQKLTPSALSEAVLELMGQGVDKRTAIKQVAEALGISRRTVYQAAIDIPATGHKEP